MCNYPEESSRPLSTMECQNAFDQLVSKTEQPKAVEQNTQEPLRIVERKPTDDPEVDEIKFNREPTFSEVKQMCSDEGISVEDETIPTLTQETIEKATEAFDDMPTDEAHEELFDAMPMDEAPEEVNEASNTEFFEEDAPDEGEDVNANSRYIGSDDWTADSTVAYLKYRGVNQSNVMDNEAIIDDIYESLNFDQRLRVMEKVPWLTDAFKEATTRYINKQREATLEAAEEKSKRQGEELSRKIEEQLQAKPSEQLKTNDEAAKFNSWEAIINMWNDIPEAVKHSLQQMPGFDAFRVSMQNQKNIEAFHERINYDPEEMFKEMSKAHDLGNISTADAANLMDEPNMISNFMSNNPEFNKWNQERMDFNAEKFDVSTKRFEDLQKKGVIPPTNCGDRQNPLLGKCTKSIWGSTSDFGDTVRTGIMPSMGDVVKDGNGFGKGDCRVSDVFQQEFERVQRINAAHPIVSPKPPMTPEESLKQLMSDMPKSMVDKILSIPGDDWKFSYDGSGFVVKYSMASREIYLTMTSSAKFIIDYRNDGPGSVQYTRHFDKLDEIKLAGKQANRLYQWYGKVMAKFFNK